MLVTAEEVSVQTGQSYTGADLDRVNSFIENVSDSIEAFCRRTFAPPVPGAVKAVALMEVRRLLNSEPGVATERVADLASGYAYGGAAVILSNSSEQALLNYLRWTSPRYQAIRLVTPNYLSDLDVPVIEAPATVMGPADIVISGRTCLEGLVQVQYSTDGFDWADVGIASSEFRSDDNPPLWRLTFMAPALPGVYRWRARFKYDGDLSKWCRSVSTNYVVV